MSAPDPDAQAWLDLKPVDRYGDPGRMFPLCSEPSPGGKMLCILPESVSQHYFEQHLGIDRRGTFRGWQDRRVRA